MLIFISQLVFPSFHFRRQPQQSRLITVLRSTHLFLLGIVFNHTDRYYIAFNYNTYPILFVVKILSQCAETLDSNLNLLDLLKLI